MLRLVITGLLVLVAAPAQGSKTLVLPYEYCTDADVRALKTWQVAQVFMGNFVVDVNGRECLLTPRQIEQVTYENFQAVNE